MKFELGFECKVLSRARRRVDHTVCLFIVLLHGYFLWQLGDFAMARVQLERAIEMPVGSHALHGLAPPHFRMIAHAYLAWTLWALGLPDQASKASATSLALVRNESPAYSLAVALIYSAEFHRFLRQPQMCATLSHEAREIASHLGFRLHEAQADYEHGWSLTCGAQVQDGLDEMISAVEALEAASAHASAWRAAPLAEAWLKIGNAEKGLELLRDALETLSRTEERLYEAELRRLMGELTLSIDSSRVMEARRSFDEAIEVARLQNAKSLELRTVLSFALLLERTGERAEAQARLSSIYGWFMEGFETPDLKEARSLLDELSA